MHSAAFILTTLLATGALSAPSNHHQHLHKRQDVVVDVVTTDVVVTNVQVVTVTNGDTAPTPAGNAAGNVVGQQYPDQSSSITTTTSSSSSTPPPYVPAPSPPPPSSAPPAQSSSPPSSGSSGSAPNSYAQAAIDAHNGARADHSTGPVQWSAGLASAAQQLASSCVWHHDVSIPAPGADKYGQNLAAASGDVSDKQCADAITDQWYKGEAAAYGPYYGQANPPDSVFENVGHFTQVLWANSTSIGCYTASCPGGIQGLNFNGAYTVCNYSPPGNYKDQYGSNVKPPN